MLTYIISMGTAIIVFAVMNRGFELNTTLSIIGALLALFILQIGISLLMRKAVNKVNAGIQEIMVDVQKRIEAKQQHFMRRPMGNPNMMLQQLQHEQTTGIERALAACDNFKPLFKWNPFLPKQVNTMRMAFNFQLKRYDEVDALLPKCVFFDPQSIAMKMARMYKKNDPGLDAFFRKKGARLRKDACILPASLYAWIQLKQGKNDDAFKTLTAAKKKSSNEILLQNWEALANGKPKQFSNAGFGDMWYALGLEEPKAQKVQQQYKYR